MDDRVQRAVDAISLYTFGMDTRNWLLAVSRFSDAVDVDYSAVGATKGTMTRGELRDFLQRLLGGDELRVHTAVSQVLVNPADSSEFIAYYSVRHYKGRLGQATKFILFGWYSFRMDADLISSLTIHVSAMEGDPNVLAG